MAETTEAQLAFIDFLATALLDVPALAEMHLQALIDKHGDEKMGEAMFWAVGTLVAELVNLTDLDHDDVVQALRVQAVDLY